ncbi:hypothetical protein M3Y96_00501400 [Aphelenchoides besseyi]|nr:hypothetical protein M3Y96_00501400 [Aphelenchoides besseyi]
MAPALMFITNRLYSPCDVGNPHYALGVYTDPRTHRLYVYAPFEKHKKKWKIFRFAVDQELLEWEFVGNLDIEMKNVCVSSCGRYFWSLEITTRIRANDPQPLFFRQVDIRTLAYEDFETSVSRISGKSRRFYVKRHVHFNRIKLPVLPTGHLVPDADDRFPDYRYAKWRTGLIEHDESIYFYRIDYFGDLHVSNWQQTGLLNWTKFSLTGNYRPLAWIESDKQDIFAAAADAGKDWSISTDRIRNSRRAYLDDGIVHEYASPEGTKM